MLSVVNKPIMLNVLMLNVVAPYHEQGIHVSEFSYVARTLIVF